jgi:hypothetical protein
MRDVFRARFNLGTTIPVKMVEHQGLCVAAAEHKHLTLVMDDDHGELVVIGEKVNGKEVTFRIPRESLSWFIAMDEAGLEAKPSAKAKAKAA